MSLASPKGSPLYPRSLSSIAVSVGGMAMFLFIASWLLVSYPIGSAVGSYFYSVETSNNIDLLISQNNETTINPSVDNNVNVNDRSLIPESSFPSESNFSNLSVPSESDLQVSVSSSTPLIVSETKESMDKSVPVTAFPSGLTQEEEARHSSGSSSVTENVEIAKPVLLGVLNNSENINTGSNDTTPVPKNSSDSSNVQENVEITKPVLSGVLNNSENINAGSNDTTPVPKNSSDSSNVQENVEIAKPVLPGLLNNSNNVNMGYDTSTNSSDPKFGDQPDLSPLSSNATRGASVDSGCDLYHGTWFYDSLGPSYTNNSCFSITQMQNCQGNGRPDKEYENWRWKPFQCDLPRFDPKKFLELMNGKTIAFIGDSVARNQMESMLCLLSEVEFPINRGNRKMQRWLFRSTSTWLIRIWSSWLVHKTSKPFENAPEGVVKLHLDAPDKDLMEIIPNFDIVVVSSGHWFAKQSVYVLNNEIVGGQLWWPDKSRPMKIDSVEAFAISVETFLTAMVTHPDYKGLTIVRAYSPDHYEGGAWNTGGSCTGKERPIAAGELVENVHTTLMHEKQAIGFNRAIKKATNKSKLRFMDITEAFSYRHDGHPGPYRNPDPNKLTKFGPDGKPPPQDCLHWCMPGPIDTWNELVLEIIRREFEGNTSKSLSS